MSGVTVEVINTLKNVVAVNNGVTHTVTASTVGIQGPRGNDGDSLRVVLTQNVGAGVAITSLGEVADPALGNLEIYAGVTKTSGLIGETVTVIRTGTITVAGAAYTPNQPVLISTSGVLSQGTQTPPFRRIGIALTADTIHLDPMPVTTPTGHTNACWDSKEW